MANPVTPTVVSTLVTTDTSASSLVVGGASPVATTGTGGINAGPIVGTTVSDSVGTMATIRAGGIGIASQAAEDLILATSSTQLKRLAKTNLGVLVTNGSGVASWLAGVASQYLRLNSGGTAFEMAAQTAPALTLIGEADGTNTTAAATTMTTIAISGLTVKDSLLVLVYHSSAGNTTNSPSLYHATDGLVLIDPVVMNGSSGLLVGEFSQASITLGVSSGNSKYVMALRTASLGATGESQATAQVAHKATTVTTDWTGSWTIALRTGTNGVVAGGTYTYKIIVYKILGQ